MSASRKVASKAEQTSAADVIASVVTPDALHAASLTLFGMHPEDAIDPIRWGSDVLGELAAILTAIERSTSDSITRDLARAGKRIADDMANTLDCEHETRKDRMELALEGTQA